VEGRIYLNTLNTRATEPYATVGVTINQSINQSFICIRPMVHIKDEKRNR